jgi:hypothetical protein
MGGVVLVGVVERDLAGADGAHERGGRVGPVQRAPQTCHVSLHRVLVLEFHRPDAVGEGDVRHRGRVEEAHRKIREISDIVRLEFRASGEAAEAFLDVGAEA